MGKVDDLRALREARYSNSRQQHPAGKSLSELRRLARTEPIAPETEALCGHQSIGKKKCIRPKDHTEKNHRYAKTT